MITNPITMATVLQPIVNELDTVLVQLRTELRGLQTDADGAGIVITTSDAPAGHSGGADIRERFSQ